MVTLTHIHACIYGACLSIPSRLRCLHMADSQLLASQFKGLRCLLPFEESLLPRSDCDADNDKEKRVFSG